MSEKYVLKRDPNYKIELIEKRYHVFYKDQLLDKAKDLKRARRAVYMHIKETTGSTQFIYPEEFLPVS